MTSIPDFDDVGGVTATGRRCPVGARGAVAVHRRRELTEVG
jgi:hypothetical protein